MTAATSLGADSRLDWIRAGYDVLRERGAVGLKLAAVVAARGATTGSFYHHFDGFGAYVGELVEQYATVDPRETFALVTHLPPVERLRALVAMTAQRNVPPLDRAMRAWAVTDARAAGAVQALDREFLRFLRRLFLDLGLPRGEAQTRALLAFSASAAIVYPPWPVTERDVDRAVALLTDLRTG